MVTGKRKVGKKVGKMKTSNEEREEEELKTVPPYKWDAIRALIERQRTTQVHGRSDKTILVLGEHELHAIASKERLRIIHMLQTVKGPSIQDLADRLDRDQAAVSRDLSILEKTGIIRKVRVGRVIKIVPGADMIILPILGKDLMGMLEPHGKKADTIEETAKSLEELMVMNIVYEKIFPRLEQKMQGHKELTLLIAKWVLQELDELPERLVKRLRSMPEECWDVHAKGKKHRTELIPAIPSKG